MRDTADFIICFIGSGFSYTRKIVWTTQFRTSRGQVLEAVGSRSRTQSEHFFLLLHYSRNLTTYCWQQISLVYLILANKMLNCLGWWGFRKGNSPSNMVARTMENPKPTIKIKQPTPRNQNNQRQRHPDNLQSALDNCLPSTNDTQQPARDEKLKKYSRPSFK